MATSKRTLFCVADGKDIHGNDTSVWVYKKGRSYYLSPAGELSREHLCHPSVKGVADIRREIHLVYYVKVEKIRYPEELV